MALYPEDKKAAFIGLIVTTLAIAIICVAIVELTNRKFAGHEGEKAAPAAQH